MHPLHSCLLAQRQAEEKAVMIIQPLELGRWEGAGVVGVRGVAVAPGPGGSCSVPWGLLNHAGHPGSQPWSRPVRPCMCGVCLPTILRWRTGSHFNSWAAAQGRALTPPQAWRAGEAHVCRTLGTEANPNPLSSGCLMTIKITLDLCQ